MADGRWLPGATLLSKRHGEGDHERQRDVRRARTNRIEIYENQATATPSARSRRVAAPAHLPAEATFPHLTEMPGGRTLVSGPRTASDSWLFSTNGTELLLDRRGKPPRRNEELRKRHPAARGGHRIQQKVMLITGGHVSFIPH